MMDFVRMIPVVGADNCRVGSVENLPKTYRLRKEKPISDGFPEDVHFVVDGKIMKSIGAKPIVQGDLIPNQNSVLLASPALALEMAPAMGLVESLNCTIFDAKKAKSAPYLILRPLEFLDVVSTPREELSVNSLDETQIMDHISKLAFDFSSVPTDVHVLVARGLPSQYLVRRSFADDIAARFKGILLRELNDPIG